MSDAASASSGFARWTSILLHPFAVFAVLALIAAWRVDPAALPRTAIGIAVAIAIVWAFVLQRRRSGRWGTVDASDRRERPILYALVLVVAAGYWWWLGGRASATGQGVVAVIAMLCVAGIANRWIKLSLHMASLAFASVAMLSLWPTAGIAALLALPLLGWSRLRMARHSLPEVFGGSALGLLAGIALGVLN
ncbi:hypothetical protein [Thermomonas carbonis]|uniref:Phosphatase PAP2 family protein n=1 Tax=Thermomonas carbonis TaxID=1463158 RepID=A0A7G9SQ98_9GAMM|nr:hypothetical protein [Thermomonas carbonis]QNN70023.1 hypothetical protein H9L16_15600 [Thermomonas carbonis]GHB97189.1 hypothetical protein GCM10010080_06540 [Thermomonas carbonis]